jgi:hypothetical protein
MSLEADSILMLVSTIIEEAFYVKIPPFAIKIHYGFAVQVRKYTILSE